MEPRYRYDPLKSSYWIAFALLEFFLAILLMLASAWVLGELFHRIGQPALVGQLLAGILIGPSILNIIQPTAALSTVENVALFFIMLLTGLAVKPSKIFAAGKRGAIVSSIAFIIPFIAGFEVARFFGIGSVSALTVGLAISITAVPVNSIILMELGLLDTDLGAVVIAAGVIDDIVSFVALSMIQQLGTANSPTNYTNIGLEIIKVAIFLCAFFACEIQLRTHLALVHKWVDQLTLRMKTPGSYILLLLIIAVSISLLAEWAGMQLVIGTFFAGLLLSDLGGREKIEKASEVIRGTTFGFFAPLAFAFIGTELVLSSIVGRLLLIASLLVVAVSSKLFGGYFGARLSRFTSAESLAIGFLMNSRGFVELVIAAIAFQLGLINQTLFSIVVCIGIITTIISPVASRRALKKTDLQAKPASEPADYSV